MKLFGFDIRLAGKSATEMSIDTLIARLTAAHETFSGVTVTPENCMMSPTVSAIVAAVSRRIATLPVKVLQTKTSAGRTSTEQLPNHPVTKLLQNPNRWADRVTFWLDSASWLVR